MRNVLFFTLFILPGALQAQFVGIGTNTPKAGLHVADSSVLFSSPNPFPVITTLSPAEGATTGMMFFSNKAAFRLGSETGTSWSGQNIGAYSASFGRNNSVRATGGFSAGLENFTTSTGDYASSFGAYNSISGIRSVTLGNYNTNQASYATALGYGLTTRSYASTVLGRYNVLEGTPDSEVASDPLLVIGNGTADNARSNALVISKNGNVVVGKSSVGTNSKVEVYSESSSFSAIEASNYSADANSAIFGRTRNAIQGGAIYGFAIQDGSIVPNTANVAYGVIGVGMGTKRGVGAYSINGTALYANSTLGLAMNTVGDVRLQGIGEANGKLLVSDANGNATWQNPIKLTMDNPLATGLSSMEWRTNNIYRGGFGYDGSAARFFFYDGESNTNTLLINNGKIGIQRDATTNALEVNGNASKTTAGSWLGNSDARLKTSITPITGALDKLLQLQGVTFFWNDTKTGFERPAGVQMGLTAQNIQQVFPENVSADAQGYLQTAYGTYDALLIEAIRELTKKVESLEQKLASIQKNNP